MISTDESFLRAAFAMAARSPCRRLQVGAVLTTIDGDLVAGAFNVHDRPCDVSKVGMCGVAEHAEVGAMRACRAGRAEALTLYVTHMPCMACARHIVAFGGVRRVVYRHPYRVTAGVEFLKRYGISVAEVFR